ncbi:uncharacterized protein MELLADRAFT_93647 [Melampsora larici-populina 98AG31]|uniref:Uncharacterized protein n=1 Tax=Melampsora larici-populina (strain 98AG31 / pathotype 3-4-7) TaxID=747676 RepID=F4R9Y8_MELLP|nr:uncharacterized protein MELLADRAFT_93647 [Melampsora larici-populina 98AG31]EGG10616.1 hypothetical protein MELLADRAFT_93647 [Melampsora larici-populina 98AG31]
MTSPILNTLPSIGDILALLPPGGNPYSFGLELVESSAFPSVEKKTYQILIGLSIIHACTILFCGTVISIPCWRKHEESKSNYKARGRSRSRGGGGGEGEGQRMIWLLKKFYITESKKTYWIPNTSLAVAICQLLTSCFCEIYTYVDYASLKSPEFAGKMSLGICVQFMWLFNFYSYFVTSWGALNTCLHLKFLFISLCLPHPSSVLTKRVISQPMILYIFCTGVPILVTIITLTWSIILAIAYRKEIDHITLVRDLLSNASKNWEAKVIPDPDEFIKIVMAGDELLKSTAHLINCLKWNSFTWAFLWTITGIFYTNSVWPLVKLMKSCSNRMRHIRVVRVGDHPNLITPSQPSSLIPNYEAPINHQSIKGVGKALRRAYIFLVCHCTVMTISVVYTILVCLIIGTHTEKVIVVARWRSLGSWLYLVSGGFSAIAMLFQSWRSYTETDVNKSSSTCISTSSITSIDLYHKLSYKLGRRQTTTSSRSTRTESSYSTSSSNHQIKEIEPVLKDLRWSDEILIIRNPKIFKNDHDLEILKEDLDLASTEDHHDDSFKSLSPLISISNFNSV